ncbi:hypothetical protein NDK47_09325 [Brevibacillus ruminantium]|uniref:IraD/Gp25-like domain-containing protein n=1 Tax=Brevibacillus ruminantium TaxID=2950604 RepID=A0ABY4WLB2_9BACL|nr:GPW/gp25 family protein [Brevibacillus ruminantium]USG67454.1 hypothetical protein NDK47_09325 [Brevibacillus ruminantium]
MEYLVLAKQNGIDFGAAGVEMILQNVAMILSTTAHSCPLDRSFAWNPDAVDAPLPLGKARVAARITAAIHEYEPRARVVDVSFQADGLSGSLKPIVKVRVHDEIFST